MLHRTVTAFAIEHLKANPKHILFLGAPGVGKGTYAARLCRDTGYDHISTGDLLRKEVAAASAIGVEAKRFMDAGNLVPSEVVQEMVKQRLLALRDEGKGFVLDGFPRNLAQAHAVDQYIDIHHCFNLHQPFEVITAKISGRRTCSQCGEGYNLAVIDTPQIKMEPLVPKEEGVCDVCTKKMDLLQRADDHIDIVRHRLNVYVEETRPVESNYNEVLHTFDVHGSTRVYYPKFLEFVKERVL